MIISRDAALWIRVMNKSIGVSEEVLVMIQYSESRTILCSTRLDPSKLIRRLFGANGGQQIGSNLHMVSVLSDGEKIFPHAAAPQPPSGSEAWVTKPRSG